MWTSPQGGWSRKWLSTQKQSINDEKESSQLAEDVVADIRAMREKAKEMGVYVQRDGPKPAAAE